MPPERGDHHPAGLLLQELRGDVRALFGEHQEPEAEIRRRDQMASVSGHATMRPKHRELRLRIPGTKHGDTTNRRIATDRAQ